MKKLIWESSFFKQYCAELENFREDFDKKKALSYNWIQSKVLIDDNDKIHYLEKNGFLFEGLKLTFNKTINNKYSHDKKNITIRESVKSDTKYVQKIAKSVLPEKSRFISVVGKKKTTNFYSHWVTKSIAHDFDDICYVAETHNNQIAGFITLKYIDKSSAQIGLLAVSIDFQKHSIASMLLAYCEKLLFKKGIKKLRVATEGKNIVAHRFFIKNKFNIKKIECWFYRK